MNSVSDYHVSGLFKTFITVSKAGGVSGFEDFAFFIAPILCPSLRDTHLSMEATYVSINK